VFEGEKFFDEQSTYKELPKQHPLNQRLQVYYDELAKLPYSDQMSDEEKELMNKIEDVQMKIKEEEKRLNMGRN
jgi:hypothetical protein